jgi:hypothetical protein
VALHGAGDGAGEVGLGIDPIELAGCDEGGDGRPVFCVAVGAGEEGVLPGEGDGTDRAFDGVGVDLDPAVVDEAGQALPAGEGVTDGLGEFALLADGLERSF